MFAVELVTDARKLSYLTEKILHADRVGFDTESSGPQLVDQKMLNVYQSTLTGFSVAFPDGTAYYVPVRHNKGNAPMQPAMATLDALVYRRQGVAWVHNLVHELQVLKQEGKEIPNHLFPPPSHWGCTQVLQWLVGRPSDDPKRPFNLKKLARTYLGMDMATFEETTGGRQFSELDPKDGLQYACDDAIAALLLADKFYPEAVELGVDAPYWEQEIPSLWVIQHMQESGFDIDTNGLTELAHELSEFKTKIVDEWEFLFPDVSIASSVQIADRLYGTVWNPEGLDKGKNGRYTTNRDAIETMLDRCKPGSVGAIAAQLKLDYQEIDKNLSTYTTGLVEKALQHRDGRLHCSYNATGTVTGRWSSSGPNLQNIPVRTELGKRVKAMFLASEGYKLVAADYSQVELRILAHYAGEGKLRYAYANGLDIHQQTADLLGITRSEAKTVNFAYVYGAGAKRLGRQLGRPKPEAQKILDAFDREYPEVKKLGPRILHAAYTRGMVRTLSRRIRRIEGLQSSDRMEVWSGERQAKNTPIQGSAGDIMKIAMNSFYSKMRANGELNNRIWMVANVHDEVTLRVEDGVEAEAAQALKECMESAATLKVPLVAEPAIGQRWTECK